MAPHNTSANRNELSGFTCWVAILVLWCCGICLRLVYLQIFRYGDFEQRAQHQQQRTKKLPPSAGLSMIARDASWPCRLR